MMFTPAERRAFARHEDEQRRHEATLPFATRLALLADMQRTAMLFGHGRPPAWAQAILDDAPSGPSQSPG